MRKEAIEGYRLSPQQRTLWPLQQNDPAYRAQCAVLLEGELDANALKDSLRDIVARHEALRSVFRRLRGIRLPLQAARDDAALLWLAVELSEKDSPDEEAAIENLFYEEGQTLFDFERGPLLRAALMRLSENRHVLIVTLPAMCADSSTLKNLVYETSLAYGARLHNDTLTGEAVQYVQFSEWQNDLQDGEDSSEAMQYWKGRNLSSLHRLKLPFERQLDDDLPFAPRSISLRIDPRVSARTEAMANQEGVSTDVILLACLKTLLWRLTGETDIVTCSIFDGRKYEELADVMGLLATCAPVEGRFESGLRFKDVAARIHESMQETYEWLEYFTLGFDEQPGADIVATSITPVIFEYEKRTTIYRSSCVTFTVIRQYACANRFKLKLSCVDSNDLLIADLLYDPNVYTEENIKRVAHYFESLVESALSAPDKTVGELDFLNEAERQQILITFNDAAFPYQLNKCIHQLIEEQADLTPAAIAVKFDGEQVTYGELNAKANQLAHMLRRRGVTMDVCVGLCLDRCAEMILGIFGILKAGGAYVPLDPEHPKSRLAFQLAEVRASVLITRRNLLSRVPDFKGEVICLDSDEEFWQSEPQTALDSAATSETLAYVIYTSGSTGLPKGVGISHRNLVNYSLFMRQRLKLDQDSPDGALHFATVSTISADLGNTSIFLSLISGGCLHVLSYETTTDEGLFAAYCSKNPIEVLKIVPSHLSALLVSGNQGSLPRRSLVMGGDVLTFDFVNRIREISDRCGIINHYGPTEATIGTLTYDLVESNNHVLLSATVPVGRPVANTYAYILDRSMNVIPVGVSGELYIGGAGLARGYVNQPGQTAERFVPNPFSTDKCERLYRTGDLARYLPDGNIEFLGRADHQVKIRGYRIELGEIESALSELDQVAEAVVVKTDGAAAGAQLVAYVVLNREASGAQLQESLSNLLPAYMVPSSFVFLDALPLTRNGKIDRKALPTLESVTETRRKEYTGARTAAEVILAGIWEEALGTKQVSIRDNFFELGGDSILSIQVISKANRAGLKLSARQLFQNPTIEELAAVAGIAETISTEQGIVTGTAPLTPIQRRFFERVTIDSHHYNQAVLLETRQPANASILRQAVSLLLSHHDALRSRFQRMQSSLRQFIAPPTEDIPFTLLDFSLLPRDQHRRAVEEVASFVQSSFDLSQEHLIRVVLMDLGGNEAMRLLIVIHHLVTDGVSWRILMEDLQLVYEQLSRGNRAKLPAKTSSYREWSERLSQYAKGDEIKRESDYWLDERRAEVKRLPVDLEGESNAVGMSGVVSVWLSEEETRELLQEVPGVYRTQINDVLLTALARTFAAWTGERGLLVNLEGHGREDIFDEIDLMRTVGFFTSIFPMYIELPERAGVGQAIKAVKEQVRRLPNRGIGYGLLRYERDEAEIENCLREMPEGEVSFNYLGQFDQVMAQGTMFRIGRESSGGNRSIRQERIHLIDVIGRVAGGKLRIEIEYGKQYYKKETIEELGENYIENLKEIIEHCKEEGAAAYTETDFPLAGIEVKKLEELVGIGIVIEDVYSLSPMQQGMLLHSLYDIESRAYFVQMTCLLRGAFRLDAFIKSWEIVMKRHPVLRTSFSWEGLEEPLQIVHRMVELPLEEEDWRGLSDAEQETRLEEFLEADRLKGFDLSRAPLMRLALIRRGEDAHQLIFSNHHLIIDGWCRPIIIREVFTCYESLCKGREANLEPVGTYRDYIAWLRVQDLARAESVWRKELEGFTSPTPLGIVAGARSQPTGKDAFRVHQAQLSEDKTADLKAMARRNQLTLNTLVQGAWALLLSRYSGNEDIMFGVTVSGRPASLPGVENMVGMFINTLPLRVRVQSDGLLITWLKELQSRQVDLSEYEYSSLVDIQGCSAIPRELPMFESILVFENYPLENSTMKPEGGLKFEQVRSIIRPTHTLTLVIWPVKELSVFVPYDSRRFDAKTVGRMMDHFTTVLEEFTLHPEGRLGDIRLENRSQISIVESVSGTQSADELEEFDFDF